MPTDKQLKEEFRKKASKSPDKYYSTSVLKQEGFTRKKCKCGTYFWSTRSDKCGSAECSGGYGFIGKTPAKKKLSYVEVWDEFAKLMKKRGYTPIARYPVVARWRDDTDFVQAGIYDFQPYVVSGEVEPPANPIVEPQFCLRFNDIDNVGITGAHYTGFVMIGQHAFFPPKEFNQAKYFADIHAWLNQGLGLNNDEIIFHEDAWAGGGNFGPCMEFFSRGIELGNQVYILYEKTPSGFKELNLKVLDMGMGHERNAWFTQATNSSYDAVFPPVMKKLHSITGIRYNKDLMNKFLPLSSYLNIDEIENVEKTWQQVAKKINIDVKELRKEIMPLAALYSVAEHSRALLVAINDGALPSNVAGGYNLRVILRRALSFIDKYGWKLNLADICKWHASYLKSLFPELTENLNEVTEILNVEKKKYYENKKRAKQIISQIIEKPITEQRLVQLYDSQGINPEQIKQEAEKINKKIEVPENFYAKVSELHEKKIEEKKKETKLDLKDVSATKALYYDVYDLTDFDAYVVKTIDKHVILDRTAFYPTSGGQMHDTGKINNDNVVDVFKQGNVIIHKMDKVGFKKGDKVHGKIDPEKRMQLTQHHTATHLINAAARRLLGNHVWQAGAAKYLDKARLDITHYEQLTDEQVGKIEAYANELVQMNIPIYKNFLKRNVAEARYGFRLYQGGAVPGKEIRVVEIPRFDVEACGGTHLDVTGDVGLIKIFKTSKIQDGVVRIEFTAGNATAEIRKDDEEIISELAKVLNVKPEEIPSRAEELFEKWKKVRKAVKKKKKVEIDFKLKEKKSFKGDILKETAKIFKTQPQHVVKTTKRFLSDLEGFKKELK